MSDLDTVPEAEIQSVPEAGDKSETVAGTEQESEESKRLKNIERRIGRLTREKHEARAEANFYREQATRQTQQHQEHEKLPLTSDDLEQALAEFQEKQQAKQKADRIQSKLNEVIDSDAEFAEALDSSDVIFPPEHLQVLQDMVDEGSNGLEVFKYIAKNQDEAERLSKLSPTALARELGRLETKVLALKKPQTSNAPKPIDSVKGSSSAGAPSEKDTAAWIKYRNEQLLKK